MIKRRERAIDTAGLLRQGDVLLVPTGEEAPDGPFVKREGGRLVLAKGEATGHAHAIRAQNARLFRPERFAAQRAWYTHRQTAETRVLLVVDREPALLEHEEHDPITVAPGVYEVRRQREYRPQRSVWVAD
jgi:hypothetical protein